MPLGTEVGLGPGDIVLDGDPAPPPLKVHSLQFSAHVRCGQTAGWTKMPLGMEVGLVPGDFVSWGPSSFIKGAQPPLFGPCLLWPNGWMDEDATLYGSRPRPRPHCVVLDGDPAPPVKRADQTPPHVFAPISIVATVTGRPSQLLLSSCTNRRPETALLVYSWQVR